MPRSSTVGLRLSIAAVAVSLVIFAVSLPGLCFGHWYQSEPPILALHCAAVLADLGLALQLVAGSRAAAKALTHPLVAIPALLGLASVAMLPFSLSPSASFLGLPQTGNGLVWFFDVASLTAAGVLAQRAKASKRLAMLAGLSTSAILVLQSPPLAAAGFAVLPLSEFAAFAVFGTAIAALNALRPNLRLYAGLCAATLAGAALSKNMSAVLALAACLGTAGALAAWKPRMLGSPYAAGGLAVLAPMVATAGHLTFTLCRWLPQGLGFSLYSRLEIYRLAVAAFCDSWPRLLVGFGWGAFPDLLIANARSIRGPLTGLVDYSPLVWEGLREPFFQAFSAYLEATLALGLAGLLGWLAWIGLAARCCPRRTRLLVLPFLAALAMLWSTWFAFPSTVPMLALGLAGCAGPRKRLRLNPLWLLLLVGVAVGWQCMAIAAGLRDATAQGREAALIRQGSVEAMTQLCKPLFPQPDRGGYYEAALLEKASRDVRQNPAFALAFLSRVCRTAPRIQQQDASLRLMEAYVRALGRLAADLPDRSWTPARTVYLPGWRKATLLLLGKAPRRSDLAVGYLLWSAKADPNGAVQVVSQILKNDPADPVGNFFLGLLQLFSSDPLVRKEAFQRLRQARNAGVERFLDIGDDLKALIEADRPQ